MKTKYSDKLAMFHCELEETILELLEVNQNIKSRFISKQNCLPVDYLGISFEHFDYMELLIIDNSIILLDEYGLPYDLHTEPTHVICEMLDKLCTKYNFN